MAGYTSRMMNPQTETATLPAEAWELSANPANTPLDKTETVALLHELFAPAPAPTPAMRDAITHYRRVVITKESAYAKR